jgi:formiminotetrahydrofolate cyclodeaminase
MNVQVNLGSIGDEGFVAKAREDLAVAASKAPAFLQCVTEGMRAAGLDF